MKGEEIFITRKGVPVERIVPPKNTKERTFVDDEGLGFVSEAFDESLPPEVLKRFYG